MFLFVLVVSRLGRASSPLRATKRIHLSAGRISPLRQYVAMLFILQPTLGVANHPKPRERSNLVRVMIFLLAMMSLGGAAATDAHNRNISKMPAAPTEGKRAWVTLLSGSSENMTSLALLQLASVRKYSQYGHVTIVTADVDEMAKSALRAGRSQIVETQMIAPRVIAMAKPWWVSVFTKFHIFALTDYDTVTYLDLDAFLTSSQADGIFDRCAAHELCAARAADLCVDDKSAYECEHGTPGGVVMMNAGVMVAHPNRDVLARLQTRLSHMDDQYQTPSKEMPPRTHTTEWTTNKVRFETLPEQEVLGAHYLRSPAESRAFSFLSNEYGCVGTDEWLNGRSEASTARAIVHNCGMPKPINLPLCSWSEGHYPFPILPANLLIARSVGPSGALRTAIMQRPRRGEVRGLAS
jgi:hypothetical protein